MCAGAGGLHMCVCMGNNIQCALRLVGEQGFSHAPVRLSRLSVGAGTYRLGSRLLFFQALGKHHLCKASALACASTSCCGWHCHLTLSSAPALQLLGHSS